jgi:hypothetical protein
MPLGKTHHVLCVACRTAVTTLYPYEERRCGFTTTTRRAEDDKIIHVSCTEDEGNDRCTGGVHYDRNVQLKFKAHGRIRATRDGHTGHA